MTRARQRETLFNSPEEKQAEIERLKSADYDLEVLEIRAQERLSMIRDDRKEIARRVQELNNLDLFEDKSKA